MQRKKISLKTIAEAAGVSQMTVSRAIHGRGGIGADLQRRITDLAQSLGYVPSRSVKGCRRGGETLTVGVVVPHFANTIFPEIIENIERYLSENGYRILLCCSYHNPIKEFREISALLERAVDGLIWCPAGREDRCEIVNLIRRSKCPLVFLDRLIENVAADAVTVDDREAMAELVRHLLGRGVRRFAYLDARLDTYTSFERLAGFREALAAAGSAVPAERILQVGADLAAGRSGAAALLALAERPEAIVCFNDPLALGAQQELRERGVAIPDEIALTGFSGVVETELAAVPITTVYQDTAKLGSETARLLFSRMVNPSARFTPVRRVIKTTMLLRTSSLR